MKEKPVKKITAICLSVLTLQTSNIACFSSSASEAADDITEESNTSSSSSISEQALNLNNIPSSLLTELETDLQDAIKLDKSSYSDLFSIGTINNDGTKSIMTFNSPVKYYDESEIIRFIDNSFSSVTADEDIAFESQGNSYKAEFPVNLDDGVSLTESGFTLNMKPLNTIESDSPQIVDDDLIYTDVNNENADIHYTLDHSGIKESIIIDAPIENTYFDFEITAEGLIPESYAGNTITFLNAENNEEVFVIQPTFIMDSFIGEYVEGEEHITYDNYYTMSTQDDGTYLLRMHLDDEFLNSESTVYPCIIDPSVWAVKNYGSSSAYVLQSQSSSYINDQLSAGTFNGSGEHISYVKANDVDKFRWIEPDRLQLAEFRVKAASTGYTDSCTINCYDSNAIFDVSSVTYSGLISAVGTLQSSATFTTLGETYSFNVTELFSNWISYELGEGGKNPDYGFILRGASGASTPGRYFSSSSSADTYFYIRYEEGEEIADGFYNIRNVSTGKYLTYNNGGNLSLSSTLNDNHKWQIILTKSPDRATTYGSYTLRPFNDLNVSMNGVTTGDYVTTSSTDNQFRIIRNADGTFRIMPATGSYARVSNAIGVNSNYASIQEYSNIDTMKWTFEPVVNRFYSEYTPEKINDFYIKDRLNCYAYAFGFVEYYDVLDGGKQQPGLFASDADKDLIKNLYAFNDSAELMNRIVYNMHLDASNIGYSLTEYTTEDDTVEQFGSDSRLIAVVASSNDRYHFYTQHNDGTWSHKTGDFAARNTAFSSTDSEPIYLDNRNIKQYVYDSYSGGICKFFIITKDAVYDYSHGKSNSPTQNVFYFSDLAGDNMFTASSISIGTTEACFDTINDVDFFVISSDTTKLCTITTTCESNYDIECEIYNYNGELVVSHTVIGQVNTKLPVYAGKNCFIKLYNYDNLAGEYTITIS